MIAGNTTILQLCMDKYNGDVPADLDKETYRQVRFSSVSMDYVPNKVREKILTGNIGEARLDTMGVKSEGSVVTLARPDDLGLFLYGTLGQQSLNGDLFKFTPNRTSLPSFKIKIDKGAGVYTYPGCIINQLSFSAELEDYLSLTLNVSGYGEEFETGNLYPIQPSLQRAFKFNQGKVYFEDTELADITSIGFSYNNNVENSIQTTSTGIHYKRPSPNTRQITLDLSCLYSPESETFRQDYFKTDNIFGVKLDFQTDEGGAGDLHRLTIEIPATQVTSCSVPISDANSIKQSMSMSGIDLGAGDIIAIYLDNGLKELYS